MTFLGMQLHSQKLEMRFPTDKLECLQQLLSDWKGQKAGKKRDLLSLIGYLQHASKAVRQGCSFLRRLITLSTSVNNLDNYVRLNVSACSDIHWWYVFAERQNGTSMLTRFDKANPQIAATSDASGTWGCRAFEGSKWLQFKWPATMEASHISIQEMIPIVMAAALWGHLWKEKSVQFWSDNSAVVALHNSGSSRENTLIHLMCCLTFIMAKYNFVASGAHIKGIHNSLVTTTESTSCPTILRHKPLQQKYPQS